MRSWHAPKTSSWLMWSSPLLLVVLVLTLTASSNAAKSPPHAIATRVNATTTTTTITTTTSPSHPAQRHSSTPTSRQHSTTSAVTTRPATTISTTTVPARSDDSSSSATDTSAPTIASASGERAANGVVDGKLSASLSASAVPLLGPGQWTLVTSAPVQASLNCAQRTVTVTGPVVVGAGQSCQLLLVATNPRVPVSWQLDPIN